MNTASPSLSWHSCLSPGSMVSPLVGVVVADDSGAAAGVSGPPSAEALGDATRVSDASLTMAHAVGA